MEQTEKKFERLLEEFEPHTYAEWKEAAEKLLKGVPFEKKMITRTYEGIELQPIYLRGDMKDLWHVNNCPEGDLLRHGGDAKGWLISQEIFGDTPEAFNELAREGVARGVTELSIAAAPEETLRFHCAEDLETALEGIDPKKTSLYFQPGSAGFGLAALFFAYLNRKGIDPQEVKGCLGIDPLGFLAANGTLPMTLDQAWRDLSEIASYVSQKAPALQTMAIHTIPYYEGGATAAQEIGFALATGVEYLRKLESAGISPAEASRQMRVSFAIGENFFMELAKFRAIRLLWARVTGACGTPCPIHVHARTGLRNKTVFDPYVNILRTSSETFSAVLGGCDSITVGCFDELYRKPGEFSTRLARNTEMVLDQECDLTRTADPAGGSWYIECLTDQLASKAWSLFQEMEQAGGMETALRKGLPQSMLADVAGNREVNLGRRKDVLVGTNMYANGRETLPEPCADGTCCCACSSAENDKPDSRRDADAVKTKLEEIGAANGTNTFALALEAAENGATLYEIGHARGPGKTETGCQPVKPRRVALLYEHLRLSALQARDQETEPQKRPSILLLQLGPSREYRLRADWTGGFFDSGGFEVKTDMEFSSDEEAVTACATLNFPVVVVVSTDQRYETSVAKVASEIKKQTPGVYLIVAGAPGEHEAAWREAGVDDFVHVRVNQYEMLEKLLKRIGVLS